MRLLVMLPGASYSTADVAHGLIAALEAQGHEIILYRLDGRITAAGAWFKYNARRAKRMGVPFTYTSADVIYKAGVDVLERALRFQPEAVLIMSGMYCHPDLMTLLKRAGLMVGLVLSESPYDAEAEMKVLPRVDIAWTNERTCVESYRAVNPNVFYLPHAYNPDVHYPGVRPEDADVAAHDVIFCGSYFQERIDLLAAVSWGGIDLGLYGETTPIPSRSKLRQYIRGGITDNATTAALYRRAKIGLNLYRTSRGFGRDAPRIDYAESLNPRAYELAATGCFHVSDWRAEVGEVFGSLVPSFETPAELEQVIRSWLSSSAERRHVAARLPAVVAGHTFDARARQLVADLERVGRPLAQVG